MLDVKKEVNLAYQRIHLHIRETPLEFCLPLSKTMNAQIYLKLENIQHTGSFKVRGAFNKILSLSPLECKKGVVAASTGNHGVAVALVLKKLNMPGVVFVPENTAQTKIDNIRNYDVQLEFYSNDCMKTELYAKEYAKKQEMVYVSPYNDPQVIGGQGTIAVELVKQLDAIDIILVPVGGGGLIAGIAGYVKSISPKTQIIGCLPENSPVMAASIKAGKMIEMTTQPTLSDATAGNVELDTITYDLCKQLVDDYILVSEDEIKNAIISLIKTQHQLIEGAAGVALAALFKNSIRFQRKNIAVILSGGNISMNVLKNLLWT